MAKTKKLTLDIDQLERVIKAGERMANVFYNIKQDEKVPERWRKWAEILQTEWDALKK
jgi:hypothetical protein